MIKFSTCDFIFPLAVILTGAAIIGFIKMAAFIGGSIKKKENQREEDEITYEGSKQSERHSDDDD